MGEFTGTPGDDVLVGTGDSDTIDGLAGADTMSGLGGDDFYYVENAGDRAIEAAGEGFDIARVSVSWTLEPGSHVEVLWAGVSGLVLTGNELVNDLWGTAGTDTLRSGGGNDAMSGFEGNDTLDGGTGADAMLGGTGDDFYLIDNAGDRAIEAASAGFDIVQASTHFALEAGSHVEVLWAGVSGLVLTGNELVNDLWGTAGTDTLNGGGGNDAMSGFGGNDTLDGGTGADAMLGGDGDDFYLIDNGGDRTIEAAASGFDIVYASASYTLEAGSHVEVLWAALSGLVLTGNELVNDLWGTAGADTLRSGGGNDAMSGFGGNDTLDGGTGADYLVGGGGDDFFHVDNGGDRAIEAASEGFDIVQASASYTLDAGSHIEVLWAALSGLTLTGNELVNDLWGTAGTDTLNSGGGNDGMSAFDGNDTLDGGTGADAMLGGGGDDFYLVDNGGDRAIEAASAGFDIVQTSASFTLEVGSHVEVLWAAASGLILTGNELANDLWGTAGTDTLNSGGGNDGMSGFGGNDVLDGGAGADYLVGGAGADSFAFSSTLGGGNVDTIADFEAGLDKILLAGAAGQPFSALASGTLAANAFLVGTAAVDANDYLIYNSTTGALLYDADGVGGAAAVQFAALATGLSLTAANFLVSGPENNDPAITSGSTNSIPENSVVSTIVYQTVATDADGDRITYTLTGADASLLTIDAGGAVRLITPADFETKSSYLFNVVASDSEASTAKAIQLTITDVPDNPSTPIINETGFPNDGTATAQFVNRNTFLVADNPNLPDDSLPSATIVGSISSDSDKDFFSVTLVAGERLILDVDGTPNTLPGLDTHLRLYNPAGTEIGDNDDLVDDDPGSNPPFGHNTDSQILFRAPTDGTYYFSIESFEGTSNGNYQIHVSIAPPATPQQILNEDIDALVSGAEWNHTNLTYGFPTSASQVPPSFREVSPASDFTPFTSLQQIVTAALLQHIATVSSLTFTQSTATNGAGHLLADLRYGMSVEAEVAYAYYPTNSGVNSPGGSAWFNDTSFNSPAKGNYAWMGILHETGHALGLKHGHEFPIAVSTDRDSTEYTVMTYRSYPGDNLSGGYSNEQWGFPQTLMMLDIAALQRMYGANFAHNAGNTVYSWSPTTGEFSIDGMGQGAPGDGVGMPGPSENRIFMTLWDGNGVDTYDFSNYGFNLTIDLRPGEWTKTDDSQRANLGAGHFARGQIANALQHDGDARSLIENAIGGTGNDLITANQAANGLTGGAGADTFVWQEIAHVGVGAQADVLADFQSGQDKIDLRSIDATSVSPGTNDGFAFIGTGAFTNTAGELRYQVEGANVRVQGDVDGNGVADLEIVVNNIAILSSTDFFL